MRVEGSVAIDAPRDQVWRFFTDPDQISGCLPGLESWSELVPGRKYALAAAVTWGPGGRANGPNRPLRLPAELEWETLDAPRRLRLGGQVRLASSVIPGTAEMALTAHPDGSTRLTFFIDAQLTAEQGGFAARIAANVLPRVTEQFFRCAKARLETAVPG